MTRLVPFLVLILPFAQADVVFMHPFQLQKALGVRMEVQPQESTRELIPGDPSKPSLWYAPGAVRVSDRGVDIWYQRVNKGEAEYMDQRTFCLARLLPDGQFQLPALRPEPPAWGGPNNVVMRRSTHKPTWGGFNVFQMAEQDGQLYLLYWDQPAEEGEAGAMLARSADGIEWEKLPGAVFTEHNDAYTLLKKDGEFLLYQTMLEPWPDKPYSDNIDKFKRVISLRHSKDLHTWTPQAVLLLPDGEDPPETEFYLMKTFPYGGGYLGLIMKYFGDPANPGKHSAILKNELLTSRDGLQWERPWRDHDMGFWPYADPFLFQAQLQFVIWKDNAMNLVSFQPDRLVGVVAEAEGSFQFPLAVAGGKVFLNAEAGGGEIQLALLKGDETIVSGSVENTGGPMVDLAFDKPVPDGDYLARVQMKHAKLFAIYTGKPR